MSSSMSNTPEPIHLHAQHVSDGVVRVMRGDEIIVAETNSADFVKDAITALKMMGHDHSTQVIIYGVSNNPAFNGAIKHHP
jgi:hypothetical protein